MRVTKNVVEFEYTDMHFVEKVGFADATQMVLDFKSTNRIPFIYDTFQLSALLCIRRRSLFLLCKNANKHYKYVTIKKKNGGIRKLCVPCSELKIVQRQILSRILDKHKVSKYATAYKKGIALKDNAQKHCGKKNLLKLDLKNFFDNIGFMQVYSSAFNTHYFPKQIGTMLTQLCCRNDVLPQGAPTSPYLSNLVMKSFDDAFGDWCERNGLSYTRYCDDITVSGDKNLYGAFCKAQSMLNKMGFEINEKKTRFVTNSNCQMVTGLTVNEFARVPSKYRQQLRQELYYVFRFGLTDAMQRSKLFSINAENTLSNAEQRYTNMLVGRLNYVLQIEPDNQSFKDMLLRLNNLISDEEDICSKYYI